MNVTSMPTPYGSAFRAACFTLGNVGAPDGVELEISAVGDYTPLGFKRVYSADSAVVNVAPYARQRLRPEPLCGAGHGFHPGTGRSVGCFVAAPGFASAAVTLCGGTEQAPANALLSAAPREVAIRPGERDEMSVISEDWVSPRVAFRRGGTDYTDTSMGMRNASGMLVAVIDADAVCASYARMTGGAASELAEFTVRLGIEQAGYSGRVVERRYAIDRLSRGGVRLAWLNRYGAVDYHTFAATEEVRTGGRRTVIETQAGYRTAATRATRSVKLLSEPSDAATAGWLAEIYSSPAVWRIDGAEWEKVEVAPGEARCSVLRPTVVEVVVSPAEANVSRKL